MGSCGGFGVKLRQNGVLRLVWDESEENWGPMEVLG